MRLWLRLAARKEKREGTAGVRDEGVRRSTVEGLCWQRSSDSSATAPWTAGRRWHGGALTGQRCETKAAASWSCCRREGGGRGLLAGGEGQKRRKQWRRGREREITIKH